MSNPIKLVIMLFFDASLNSLSRQALASETHGNSMQEKPPPKVQLLVVSDDHDGQRLDNYLLARLKGVPKSLIYRVIRKGEVRVNKGRAKPARKLDAGDEVRVPPIRQGEKRAVSALSEGLAALLRSSILYESDDLLVVNKPAGLAVHGGSGVSIGMIEGLRQLFPAVRMLELVHRLDRDTSGCVMVAKKRAMLKYLQHLLRGDGADQVIDKQYLALVLGRWSKRRVLVNAPLVKNELQSGERVVKVDLQGKPSRTQFEIVQRYLTPSEEEATLLRVKPITGRTHQIRVHALHAGHPLLADDKYGDKVFNQSMKAHGAKRLFLHAASLAFRMPSGEAFRVEAPLPQDLAGVLDRLTVAAH